MRGLILLLFFFISGNVTAQFLPAEGSQLNYRIVGFSFEKKKKTSGYMVQVARGHLLSEADFSSKIVATFSGAVERIVGELPSFATEYTWRVVGESKDGSKNTIGGLHHFTVVGSEYVDSTMNHLLVTKPASAYQKGLVLPDVSRVMYDMSGSPVWFLPDIPGVTDTKSVVRELTLTSQGTFTFLCDEKAYEVDYNGKLLWRGPDNGKVSGDSLEHYHHELVRLKNGHYMVLGDEYVTWRVPAADFGTSMVVFDASGKRTTSTVGNERLEFGTLIEYNEKGDVVWSWKSSVYFKDTYDRQERLKQDVLHSHANAFFFDEANRVVWVSFKNVSQVLKVSYPGGEVLAAYGKTMVPGTRRVADGTFCEQHNCQVVPGGYLGLFNNNMCHLDQPPGLLILEEPKDGKGPLKKVWEYNYPLTMTGNRSSMTQGGGFTPLPGGDWFVSYCNPYGNMFIVDKNKQLLWDARYERYSQQRHKWEAAAPYRTLFLKDAGELERAIWREAE